MRVNALSSAVSIPTFSGSSSIIALKRANCGINTVFTASPVTEPDTSETVMQAADPVVAALDSLRNEVARLNATVMARQPASTAVDSTIAAVDLPREAVQQVQNIGLRTFWAIVVLTLAWLLIWTAVWLLEALAERQAARRLFFKKLIPIARLLIWTFAIYYVLSGVFNIDRSGLLAAGAALGVGIGFAAQGILKNFLGGLIIVFDQPFQVGDKISVGGSYGEVVSIGMRATRIVTPDDSLVSVPNSQLVEGQVSNTNAGALDCQVVVDLYLPASVDVAKAKSIAFNAAANSKYVYLKKPIVVNVKDEFKETFLTHLVVKSYVIDTRYEFALASDITEAAKMEFLRQGMMTPAIVGARPFRQALEAEPDLPSYEPR